MTDIRLYAFHCGGDRSDLAIFDPFDPNVGTKIYAPYFFYLVRHPQGNVLFDSGVHPALRDDPHGRIGDAADAIVVEMEADDDVVSQLAKVGLEPSDIDHVVQSHLHFDHAGGLEFFPDATVYVQQSELSFAFWPAVYQRGLYIRADFDHPLRWKELDGEYDMFGDGRIVLLPTPGHTPGHQSMIVRLEEQPIVLLSDATYMMEKMRQRLLPAIVWSPDAMVASWHRLEEIERRLGARLICTHDVDFRETMKLAPEEWYE
jgi:glyoxylase-like metal-dependent hydrolase (beta-lactamase superfamily II)